MVSDVSDSLRPMSIVVDETNIHALFWGFDLTRPPLGDARRGQGRVAPREARASLTPSTSTCSTVRIDGACCKRAWERQGALQLVNGFRLLFGCADVVGATGDGQVPGKVSRRYPILVVGSSPSFAAGVSRRRKDSGQRCQSFRFVRAYAAARTLKRG